MNVAQKVRLWFMLGISILMAICIIGLGSVPAYQLAQGGGETWFAWVLITFVANVTLGSICIFRFTHPLPPKPAYPYPPAPGYYPPQQPGPVPPTQQPPAGWFGPQGGQR